MGWKRRILFGLAYLTGNTPWDTGVTPPEVIRLVQSGDLMPGRAVDLGCGTGLNAIYLVRHGWEVTGVDGAAAAIRRARRRVEREAAALSQHIRFVVGEVTNWRWADAPFDLALDIGCLHGLSATEQRSYAAQLSRYTTPDAHFLLYARGAQRLDGQAAPFGLDQAQIEALLTPTWRLVWAQHGQEGPFASAWYLFRRDDL